MQPKTAKRRSAFRRANRTMPRRRIDMPAYMHRKITREIKRSRSMLLMK
jgi:small subunit ribosomal protein S18